MARLPPEPITGFDAATSGVAHEHPNPPAPGTEGSLRPQPFWPPNGLAKFGWLKILKNSARNCTLTRSPKWKSFVVEKSVFRKPKSRNVLRPMVPKLPGAGGVITDFPSA